MRWLTLITLFRMKLKPRPLPRCRFRRWTRQRGVRKDFWMGRFARDHQPWAGRDLFWPAAVQWNTYPPFPVTSIDSTGAGDAFIGSFAVFLAERATEREAVTTREPVRGTFDDECRNAEIFLRSPSLRSGVDWSGLN